jgi:hypothetical protein
VVDGVDNAGECENDLGVVGLVQERGFPGAVHVVLAPPQELLQSAVGPTVGELPCGLFEFGKSVQLRSSVWPWRRPGG